jgi:ATP/ADP translocase
MLGSQGRLFAFFAMCSGFCIASEYAITRSVSGSLFLSQFSAEGIPWVWLATVPFNFSIVWLYNRFLPVIGPFRMVAATAACAIALNGAVFLLGEAAPWLIFLHFGWKDIYILLMFKQLWSLIHTTISQERAKYLYGFIFGMGTLGSIVGSLVPSFLAEVVGSRSLLLATLPLYTALLFCYRQAYFRSALAPSAPVAAPSAPASTSLLQLFRNSPYLWIVLSLVVCMQMSAGLMEYRFNGWLEQEIPLLDSRTAFLGKVVGITNILSGAFQWIGGFLIIHLLGVRGSHLAIPLLLLANGLSLLLFPSFALLTLSYVLLKAIDFSFFGIVREMLYIPLDLDQKFRAKAVIDVFAYRTSKAFVSLFILGLQALAAAYLFKLVSLIAIIVLLAWLSIALIFFLRRSPSAA